MPFTRLFYHFVWTTKNREPWLKGEVEKLTYRVLRAKALELKAAVHALSGVEDHVHLVVSVPPTLALARFIGQLKGASSSRINKSQLLAEHFAWQKEYGAFSFDQKRLPRLIAYVENQKQHHAEGTEITILEKASPSQGESS